jgi:hypothetical protein
MFASSASLRMQEASFTGNLDASSWNFQHTKFPSRTRRGSAGISVGWLKTPGGRVDAAAARGHVNRQGLKSGFLVLTGFLDRGVPEPWSSKLT